MYEASSNPLKHAGRLSALVFLIWCNALIAQGQVLTPAPVVLPDPITLGVRVEQGDTSTVAEWLAAGLDPNSEADRIGTGLMIAAWYGNIAMMELFVKHGADVNRTNRFNEQALMQAVWKGQREAAVWLIEHGARVNRDGKAWSALHYAAFAGHVQIARLLMQNGADVNAKTNNGSTALMMAAHEGSEKIAEMLLAAGADRAAKNDRGDDAMTWSMRYQHLTIARMISTADEFAKAVVQPKENWGEPVVTLPAPVEVENILQEARVARANGSTRVLTDEDYRKVLARIATMKHPANATRVPRRMSITAKKGDPSREGAELQYGK
jgi:hypothetical protein